MADTKPTRKIEKLDLPTSAELQFPKHPKSCRCGGRGYFLDDSGVCNCGSGEGCDVHNDLWKTKVRCPDQDKPAQSAESHLNEVVLTLADFPRKFREIANELSKAGWCDLSLETHGYADMLEAAIENESKVKVGESPIEWARKHDTLDKPLNPFEAAPSLLEAARRENDERCARYGCDNDNQLQFKWRNPATLPETFDINEAEAALMDAFIRQGGAYVWPGDGSSCAAQIVEAVWNRPRPSSAEPTSAAEFHTKWEREHADGGTLGREQIIAELEAYAATHRR